MASPDIIETTYYAESMSVEQNELDYEHVPGCIQIMFDAFLTLYTRFIDTTLGRTIVVDDEVDDEDKLTLDDIETIAELNEELEKLTDEAKQCIVELEWYMKKYPDDVRLKEELMPIAAEVHAALGHEDEDDDDNDDSEECVQETE